MLYQLQYLKQQKFQFTSYKSIYEGINYEVFEDQNGKINKFYKFQNYEEMNELLKTLDIETYFSKNTQILISPISYQIDQINNKVIINYEKQNSQILEFIITCQNKIMNESEDNEDIEDKQLLNELIDDEEDIALKKVDDKSFKEKLVDFINKIGLRQNLINTILQLFELELKGFIITNIKKTNTFYNKDKLLFMDTFLQSRIFEVSLEEFLILDYIKQQYQSQYKNVIELGKIYLSLFLMIDYKDQQVKEYLELTQDYYGSKIHNIIKLMISGDMKLFCQIVNSQEYIELISPISDQQNHELRKLFIETQQQEKQLIWNRIQQRFFEDNITQLWDSVYRSNFNFFNKAKQNPKYRIEYQIQNQQLFKCENKITGMIIINVKVGDSFERGIMLITQCGQLMIYSSGQLLSTHKFSNQALRGITKFSQNHQIFITFGGDEKIIYVFLQSQFFSLDPKPLYQLKDQIKQIVCLVGYELGESVFLICGDSIGQIIIYKDWQKHKVLQAHTQKCSQLTHYNNFVYSSSLDGTLKIFDEFNFVITHIISGLPSIKTFFPNNVEIYIFCNDKSIRLFQFNKYQYQIIYMQNVQFCINSCIKYNEDFLIFGDDIGIISIYDQINRKIVYNKKNSINSVYGLTWISVSQNIFCNYGNDNIVKINQLIQ